MERPLLAVRRLKVHYPVPGFWPWRKTGLVRAVDGVDFNLSAGETLGIVGESGSGKSSLARALVGLEKLSSGAIEYQGQNIARLDDRQWRGLRSDIQMIFQDPLASLNPRMNIARCIGEPLRALHPEMSAEERDTRVLAMMDRVGLSRELANRYPHEFSGGQCQRVGIARALIVEPRVLVCDEPVSALDTSVQAQVLNLLMDLQEEFELSYLFISHDLSVVRHIANEVMVMYLGRAVEQGTRDRIFSAPRHPYTRVLLSSTPSTDPRQARQRLSAAGELPSPLNPPPGCAFHRRCPFAVELCKVERPALREVDGRLVACHRAEEDLPAPRETAAAV